MDALIVLIKNPITAAERPSALRVFTHAQMLKLKTAFVEDTICICAQLEGLELKVAVAPAERTSLVKRAVNNLVERFPSREVFSSLPGRVEILSQKIAPLAERLQASVDYCFAEKYQRVMVVGGYNPTITHANLSDALRELRRQPVILGPTIRGGFYLIGMDANRPELFADVPVGTDDAYRAICDRLTTMDEKWKELDLWYDVSHQEDIEFIVRDINQFRLTGDEDSARATEDVLAQYLDQEKDLAFQ